MGEGQAQSRASAAQVAAELAALRAEVEKLRTRVAEHEVVLAGRLGVLHRQRQMTEK